MLKFLGLLVVTAPLLLTAILGLCMLLRIQLSERSISRLTATAVAVGLLASLAILATMLLTDSRYVPVSAGDWVRLPDSEASHASDTPATPEHHFTPGSPEEAHFHFTLKFVFDRLSVPFVVMTFVLSGVISAFASRYLHREQGFPRFFLFFSFFLTGMILSSAAGTIETLFFGWELVGLSSALLVAFFQDRRGPVQNGLRVWSIYRVADAAFLLAALTLHHLSGSGDFAGLAGQGAWPEGNVVISPTSAILVGLLLLFAAAGKSALIPFSGWLPRAMEGPTPSSAVFYGALSVHLGAFLLLRMGPLLEQSLLLQALVVFLGLSTCAFAAMASRVQADIKSSLAFASLIQVSLIVTEIGFGLRYIPLIHIIGHACFRTLQLVRAPSLLKDYNAMINALGDRVSATEKIGVTAPKREARLYRFAFDRGNLDPILDEYLVRPITAAFLWSDRMERRWTTWLSGSHSTGQGRVGQHASDDSAMSG
ncbi:MAG UNVERIFIED_CONTAM: oxidoreductase [Planctomycetaceae bacterium]|jgi:NAD(P)H-quinone oxidoreductase subunit 5